MFRITRDGAHLNRKFNELFTVYVHVIAGPSFVQFEMRCAVELLSIIIIIVIDSLILNAGYVYEYFFSVL